jgi:hypothetical protein
MPRTHRGERYDRALEREDRLRDYFDADTGVVIETFLREREQRAGGALPSSSGFSRRAADDHATTHHEEEAA